MNMDKQHHKSTYMACLLIALLMTATQSYAGNAIHNLAHQTDALQADSELTPRSLAGKFFGYDQKTREIWVNDFVYMLSADYSVIGSSTKLGLLSAIKHQEVVEFETAPNPKYPSIPYIVEIRRK